MNIEQIKKLSPVKIIYQYLPDCGGEYSRTPLLIKIDKSNSDCYYRAVLLLHEIGHAIHDAKNCQCMATPYSSHTLAEYHAERFVMKHIQNDKKLIAEFINKVIRASTSFSRPHQIAARRIMKLKAWDKLQ